MSLTLGDRLQTVSPDALNQQLAQDAVLLVDVREPAEYTGEHIPGSISVPLSRFSPDRLPTDPQRQLVLYCRTSSRSAIAAQRLFKAGVPHVVHLQGGIDAWKRAGFETEKNLNAPISIMRQVQIVAGSLVLIGTLLGAFVSPWFLLLSGFVGAGLLFAGISDTCAMALLLAKLPYNQRV